MVKLRRSPGEDEEYDLTFQPTHSYQEIAGLVGRVHGTRQRMVSIISELGIEDSRMTVFEAGNLGSTARHVSFRPADVDYLLRLIKSQVISIPARGSAPLPQVQRPSKI